MKAPLTLFSLTPLTVSLVTGCSSIVPQAHEKPRQSPFVGMWDWEKNSPGEHSFNIRIGERNDSLLFSINGIFHEGRKIHTSPSDNNWEDIPVVKIPKPKGSVAKSKISECFSNFYFDQDRMKTYNDVSFELLSDTTMLFILNDNKYYWPDTAIMFRRDKINRKFSYQEEDLMYKGK